MMTESAKFEAITKDKWFDGSLTLAQPAKGFRATTDAILLAAAIPDGAQHPIELGAGVGAVALALAARLETMPITAVEHNPDLAELLEANIAENGFGGRITPVIGDALAKRAAWHGCHDLALANPPYNDAKSSLSASSLRQSAMASADLRGWVSALASALVAKGRMVMISRADRLDELLAALEPEFGDCSLRPIHSRADQPACRILLSARKGVRGAFCLLPPLVMHQDETTLTQEMAAIGKGGAIDMLPPSRKFSVPHLK